MLALHSDYKKIVTERVEAAPRKGRGEYQRIAAHLKVNASLLSQIFRGTKDLTMEQASSLADYLGFNDLEAEYFIQLVAIERAGSVSLKKRLTRRLREIAQELQQVNVRVKPKVELDEASKATFYSNWYYSGIRLASALEGLGNVEAMAAYFELPRTTVRKVVQFLLSVGLCAGTEDNFTMGPSRTHVNANSPLVTRHHSNWRLKALQAMDLRDDKDLFFSSPMTLSEADADRLRVLLLELIEKSATIVDPSPSETLRCLNIDWFEV